MSHQDQEVVARSIHQQIVVVQPLRLQQEERLHPDHHYLVVVVYFVLQNFQLLWWNVDSAN